MVFSDQTCLVTGGGRGIGLAIVQMFAAAGARVHSLDIEHGDTANGVTPHLCDVSDQAAVASAVGKIDGPIDVLVINAAAVTSAVPITELSIEEWERTLRINLTGVFIVSRTVLPRMVQGGRIINMASTFAHVGSPGRVAYSATKAAVLGFTRSLAIDVAEQGIRVNSVSPGAVATDRLTELFGSQENADAHLGPMHLMARTAKPEEIADAVWFLSSPRSSFMTGADLLVDGGYTAR